MKTIAEYGNKKIEKVNAALEAIKKGGSFNGTVYAKATKKDMFIVSVYVSKQEFCIGEIQKCDFDAVKAEFLAVISEQNNGKTTSNKDERFIFGTEAWLHSGMNAE